MTAGKQQGQWPERRGRKHAGRAGGSRLAGVLWPPHPSFRHCGECKHSEAEGAQDRPRRALQIPRTAENQPGRQERTARQAVRTAELRRRTRGSRPQVGRPGLGARSAAPGKTGATRTPAGVHAALHHEDSSAAETRRPQTRQTAPEREEARESAAKVRTRARANAATTNLYEPLRRPGAGRRPGRNPRATDRDEREAAGGGRR